MTYFSGCCRSGDERAMSRDSIKTTNAIEITTAHQNAELSPHSHADEEPCDRREARSPAVIAGIPVAMAISIHETANIGFRVNPATERLHSPGRDK